MGINEYQMWFPPLTIIPNLSNVSQNKDIKTQEYPHSTNLLLNQVQKKRFEFSLELKMQTGHTS